MQEKYGIVSNDGHINSLYVLWAKEQHTHCTLWGRICIESPFFIFVESRKAFSFLVPNINVGIFSKTKN